MYALSNKRYGYIDIVFTDDDIIDKTPVGRYVEKSLKIMRDNFDVYTDQETTYYTTLFGHEIKLNKSVFVVGDIIFRDKLNKAKHVRTE